MLYKRKRRDCPPKDRSVKTKAIMTLCCALFATAFCLFAVFYQGHVRSKALVQLHDHAKVIANSLWTFETNSPTAYLTLAAEANAYKSVVVMDDQGRTFLDIRGPRQSKMDAFLMSVNLIPAYRLEAAIEFEGKRIGTISALWPCRTIYPYLYILFCLFLVLTGIWLYLKLMDSNRMLESRVKRRTAELEKENRQRRRTEEALRQATLVVENSPVMLFRWKAEEGWPVVLVSQNVTQIGYTSEELLDGSTPFSAIVHPEDIGRVIDEVHTYVAGGAHRFQQEYRIITKDGHIRWVDDRTAVERDTEGRTSHFQGIIVDITERKQAEETLRKYERIVSSSQDLMALINTYYVYEAVNESFLRSRNKQREEVVGKSVAEVTGEKIFQEKIQPWMDRAFSGQTVRYQEVFHIAGLGQRIMDVTYFPMRNEKGDIEGVVLNARDVTETRNLEEQLIQSQKIESIGTLASGVAHDFNNILGAVIGYSELAILDTEEDSKARKSIEMVLAAGERAKDLVQQILTFSRQSEEERKPVQIAHTVKEVLKFLRASLPTTIEIRQQIDTDLGYVMADPAQIHQVVMNLCTNAHHAMKEKGGVLDVRLASWVLDRKQATVHPHLEPGPYVKVTVKDTGPGMDKTITDKIFDPYFTTKEKGVGTGLGLAIVHGIVEKHGGAITLESEPGKGASFEILFPSIEQKEILKSPKREEIPGGHEHILLIDDEQVLVDLGRQMLERLGYTVETQISSIDALALFRAEPSRFDLVITDMTMPDMTGERLAMELMRIQPDIPVILCTGYSETDLEERAGNIGIRALVMKPVVISELSKSIRMALAGKEDDLDRT